MAGFVPVRLDQFVLQYVRNNKGADGDRLRAAVEDALAAWRQGVRCACGNRLWVAGSAIAGYGCFGCITGSAEPDGDPEIDEACEGFYFEEGGMRLEVEQVSAIIRKHPHDYREHLELLGFEWHDDEYDAVFEEEVREEREAVPETENQWRLVHFLENGGPVTRQVMDAYLQERHSETSNLPLIRKYFKQANTNLKAILMTGLAANPTDLELLDDLSYYSEFDSVLSELIRFYTDACLKETDMERFSLLAQDFHMNTFNHGYDAIYELLTLFRSGTKGAVIQHLSETIDDYQNAEDIPF
ncbi:MAG: hypothetical protein CSA23_07295 [Deltaproteobacteria bacterium]|nr:MAG: hypothetical protein CSA23_07295 [Deltaproteobacteria bacterium]